MEIRNLRTLVEVVRQGGFSAAAKTLGATQPTVSKAIRQLEEDCGAPLLERLGQGIRLTTAGEAVYRRAQVILAERENLLADLADLQGLRRGSLRLGFPPLGSSILFAPLMAAYRKLYPEIEIEVRQEGSHRLEEAVLCGEIEMGVSLLPITGDFNWQLVCDEPLMVLLPTGHPLSRRPSLKLAELAQSPFILFEKGFALNSLIINACQKRGFTPEEAARSGHTDFIIALVAAGLGVALLPRLVVKSREQLSVRPILLDEPDLRWQLALIWRRNGSLSPAARRWLELVKEGH